MEVSEIIEFILYTVVCLSALTCLIILLVDTLRTSKQMNQHLKESHEKYMETMKRIAEESDKVRADLRNHDTIVKD